MIKGLLVLIVFLFSSSLVNSQEYLNEFSPYKIEPINLSKEGANEFEKIRAKYSAIIGKMTKNFTKENLTKAERKLIDSVDETIEDYWSIYLGCGWYCGGDTDKVEASSSLCDEDDEYCEFSAEHAHDLSLETSWATGGKGSGIGEYLLYTFSGNTPAITNIIIANGFVADENIWKEYGRAKAIKVYLNETPLGILNLKDERASQFFDIEPISSEHRKDIIYPQGENWTLRFEITEVYEGSKYPNVCIGEIYFDGYHNHHTNAHVGH